LPTPRLAHPLRGAGNFAGMRRWVLWGTGALATVAVLVVLAVFGLAGSSSAARRAPALPAQVLIAPRVTLHSLLGGAGGRAVAVVFWASWCEPCEREAPAIERFATSEDGRARVAGVDWSDALGGAREFVQRYHWTFPNVRDGSGRAGNAYRLIDLPTTFVISGDGRIRQVLRGPQDGASLARALAIAEGAARVD
jgi:thiol-disulfide isomerase/thioredoxin